MATSKEKYALRHYEAALDLFEQGACEKALEQIRKAIANDPKNPDYHSTMGIFLHKMNDIGLAIEAYHRAIAIRPAHTFAHFNLGLIFMKMGKTVDAIKEWEAVLKEAPKDVDAIFNIAVALAHVGKVKESIPFYKKVIALKPDHVQSHQNLGIIYRDEQNYERARHHLLKLRELDSTYAEVVESELRKCQEQEFLRTIEKISSTSQIPATDFGDDPETMALAAVLQLNFAEALRQIEPVLAKDPGNLNARIIRGQALAGIGESNDAIAQFMAIAAEYPECLDALFNLGNIFLGMNNDEKALPYFEKVLELDPAYPLIQENVQSLRHKLKIQK